MMQNSKLRLSVRWKLIIPFVFIILLVLGVLLPFTNNLVSNRIEAEADHRLSQIAESAAALMESNEEQTMLSASFVGNLPEVRAAAAAEDAATRLEAVLLPRRDSLDLRELSF